MKKLLQVLPLPAAAVGLSFVGLANLFSEIKLLSIICVTVSGWILLSVSLKIMFDFHGFLKQIKEVPLAAIAPTLSMGMILISKFLLTWSYWLAFLIWFLGIFIHVSLLIYFTTTFVNKKQLSLVLPSWFIVYVGIVVASMTASMFDQQNLGEIIYFFGFLAFLILLPVVLKRLKNLPLPEPLRPTLAILAAPVSLNLAGYMMAFDEKIVWFVVIQLVAAQALYVFVLCQLPKLLCLPFYPSSAALTFPLVISAMAFKLSTGFLGSVYPNMSGLFWFILRLDQAIALGVVPIVSIRYLRFMTKQWKVAKK
ncbi:TDT family transporter [Vagococcus elongatus]|uniref:C4-dicarboxylate ABC transporter n=1 Tax=Vagococcus elongatus TaxID=180344 RepID=A0A430AL45_9ENTE|nr:TDT family transporter [Vagococcus elongatus]RSU08850.1 hypothetical protein CBF29_13070 [Vagococcus elongatus]